MARMTIAALAAVLLLAVAHQAAASRELKVVPPPACAPPTCPSGFKPLYIGDRGKYGTSCGYQCYTPCKLNCPASIGGAYICGGTTNIPCPTVACAYSSSLSISGPGGCATAQSKVDAFAFSNFTYNSAYGVMEPILKSYCDASNDNLMPLELAVSETINALATAIADTLQHYETYVCSCCIGNSKAYTVVGADVQAVATAQAYAFQELLGTVTNCFTTPYAPGGQLLAGAYAKAEAFAQDVQVAINKVYADAVSNKGFKCGASGFWAPKIKAAVAKAAACTFANIYAAAIDAQHGGAAYACAATATISGSLAGSPVTCPLDLPCDCTPTDYQYNNLGFETGTLTPGFDGNPNWNVAQTGSQTPTVITSDTLNIGGTNKQLLPKEKSYFAVIPAGSGVNSISTSFTVPPCATKISASYVFKCNDYNPFNDAATFSLVVTNAQTGAAVTSSDINVDCSAVGYAPFPACSDSSAGSPGLATNNGDWTTIDILVAPGVYTVSVVANARQTDGICASKLYVDDIKFA